MSPTPNASLNRAPTAVECCLWLSDHLRRTGWPVYADRIDDLLLEHRELEQRLENELEGGRSFFRGLLVALLITASMLTAGAIVIIGHCP